jgi:hypothetical protein
VEEGSKISAAAIWAEPPNLCFPKFFIQVLELEYFHSYISERVEVVRERINKRIDDENQKKLEKQEKQQREQDSLIEQKRKRLEEINNRREA